MIVQANTKKDDKQKQIEDSQSNANIVLLSGVDSIVELNSDVE